MSMSESNKTANTQPSSTATHRQSEEHEPVRHGDAPRANKPSLPAQGQTARGDAGSLSRLTQQLGKDSGAESLMGDNFRDLKSLMEGTMSGRITTGEAGELVQALAQRETGMAAAVKDGKLDDKELRQLNQLDSAFDKKLDQLAGNNQKTSPIKQAQLELTVDLGRNLMQQSLIFRGITDGSLTPKELSAVLNNQASLHTLLSRGTQDGTFSQADKTGIDTALKQADQLRYALRHNNDGQVAGNQTKTPGQELQEASLSFAESQLNFTSGMTLPPGLTQSPELSKELANRAEFNQQWGLKYSEASRTGSSDLGTKLLQSAQSETTRRRLFDTSHALKQSLTNPASPSSSATPEVKNRIKDEVAKRENFDRAWHASSDPSNIMSGATELARRGLFDSSGIELPNGLAASPELSKELANRTAFNQQWGFMSADASRTGSSESGTKLLQYAQAETTRRQLFDSSHVLKESLTNPGFAKTVATPETMTLIEKEVARRESFNRTWQASNDPSTTMLLAEELQRRSLFDMAVSIYRPLSQTDQPAPQFGGTSDDRALQREYDKRTAFNQDLLSQISHWNASFTDSSFSGVIDKLAPQEKGLSVNDLIAAQQELMRRQKVDSGILKPGADLA